MRDFNYEPFARFEVDLGNVDIEKERIVLALGAMYSRSEKTPRVPFNLVIRSEKPCRLKEVEWPKDLIEKHGRFYQ